MEDDRKPKGLQTQFGDLDQRTSAVEGDTAKIIRRLGEQDTKLVQIETQGRLALKQVAAQDKELLLVKQSTARIEAVQERLAEKVEPLHEAMDYGKKTFKLVHFVFTKVAPLIGAIGAAIVYFK
jgi:chromosome segregation ATPase